MAVNRKGNKRARVVVEEVETSEPLDLIENVKDDAEEENTENRMEIKEEIETVDDDYPSNDLSDCVEVKNEDDDDIEIKSEPIEDEVASDISDDSDVQLGDSDDEITIQNSRKEKVSNQEVTAGDSSSESDTAFAGESDDDVGEEEEEGDEDDDEEEEEEEDVDEQKDDLEDTKSGLANVMAKILSARGNADSMLSKAKKDTQRIKEEEVGDFEFVDAEGNIKKEVKLEVVDEEDDKERVLRKQREREEIVKKLKLKPDRETDHEKERQLRITATQGVVQLFSAIEKHRTAVRKERSEIKSVVAREEMSSQAIQESFLDILNKEGEKLNKSRKGKKIKRELKEEPIDLPASSKKPKWSVFADNFYKEPKLQGWDTKSDDEE